MTLAIGILLLLIALIISLDLNWPRETEAERQQRRIDNARRKGL